MKKRDGINHFRQNAFLWNAGGGLLQTANLVLGLSAVILTLTVASKPFGTKVDYVLLGYLAAAATAALTFLRAEERGRAWSRAGRYLEDEIGRYDVDQTHTYNDVATAREAAIAMTSR